MPLHTLDKGPLSRLQSGLHGFWALPHVVAEGPEAAQPQGLPTSLTNMTSSPWPPNLSNKAHGWFPRADQGEGSGEGRKRLTIMPHSPHFPISSITAYPPSSSKPTNPTHINTSKQILGEQGKPNASGNHMAALPQLANLLLSQ